MVGPLPPAEQPPSNGISTNTTPEPAHAAQTPSSPRPISLERSSEEPARPATVSAEPPQSESGVSALSVPSMLPGLLMAAAVLVLLFTLVGRLRRNARKRGGEMPTAKEQIAAIRARASDRSQIEAYKVDAHDFTRQMAALLDSKAERLEQLIADADERLARLESRGGGHDTAERPHRHREHPASDDHPAGDPAHERIYKLADSGMNAIEIARQTGQPTGQVELILALRG